MSDYNVIAGLKIKYLSADPSNPEDGQVWYNSSASKLRVEGVLGTGAWSAGGVANTAVYELAGAGTQTAALKMGGSPNGSSSTNATEEYNGSSWTSGGDMNTDRNGLGGAGTQTAAIGFGGGPSSTAATELYDGSSWTNTTNLINARSNTSGCGTQTAALAVGGGGGPVRSSSEEFSNATSAGTRTVGTN